MQKAENTVMTAPRLLLPAAIIVMAAASAPAADRQAPAQVTGLSASAPLAIGETVTLASTTLKETRRINVYLPPAYSDTATTRLPVLYMPDGGVQEDFIHVAGLVQVLTGNGTMRPFILVGIENTERRRDLPGPTDNAEDRKMAPRAGGAPLFRTFIRRELMPAIRARYRTTDETAIVGESLAGLFVVETFLREPDLFNTYIAFDPSLWWNDGGLVKESAALLKDRRSESTLYLATSSQGDVDGTVSKFAAIVDAAAGGATRLTYTKFPNELHSTIYHPAALTAFRALFKPSK
jgi:predicted alpha/beta superfamily hydrolase